MMRIMAYLRGIRKTCCAVCLSSIAALELMAYISHGSLRTCTLLTEDLQLPDASAVAGTFMHDMVPIRRQAPSVEPTLFTAWKTIASVQSPAQQLLSSFSR